MPSSTTLFTKTRLLLHLLLPGMPCKMATYGKLIATKRYKPCDGSGADLAEAKLEVIPAYVVPLPASRGFGLKVLLQVNKVGQQIEVTS
ncbi:hypothetical protein HDV57DRAFT_501313 [Trichoderma longibrachiatum]